MKLIITEHNPGKKNLQILAGLILLIGMLVLSFYLGGKITISENRKIREEMAGLELTIVELEQERARLQQNVARLGREAQVLRISRKENELKLLELKNELQQQSEDLEFFYGLLGDASGQSGLQVHEFRISATHQASVYRLRLILKQQLTRAEKISGRINLELSGLLKGKPWQGPLTLLEEDKLTFMFRYFQIIEAEFVLPDGLEPHSLKMKLEVLAGKTRGEVVEHRYQWETVLPTRE